MLEVFEGDTKLSHEALLKRASSLVEDFETVYPVYKELREGGFIVRSALKYGADFAVYTKRPGLEHAPYLVKVLPYDKVIDPGDLIGWGRVSHSVRKDLLLAITYPSGKIDYIIFKWIRP